MTASDETVPPGFSALDLSGDPFAALAGPFYERLEEGLEEGQSPVRLGFRVLLKHRNPSGNCHGGLLMTAMDLALGRAVLYAAPDPAFTPTMTMGHDFLAGAKLGEWLESRVNLVHTTRRAGFANGILVGANGPVVRSNAVFRLSGQARPGIG